MAVLPPDPVFNLRCPEMGPVNSICFHQNERLLAGTAKGNVHLWDLQTNRSPLNFEASANQPITALHHTDDFLISQEKGGTVKKWSLSNTGYVLGSTFEAQHNAFCRTQFAYDAGFLVLPKGDNEIAIITLDDFQIQQTLTPNTTVPLGLVSCLRPVEINGQYYVIAGYESGHIITWDLRCCKVINQEQLFESPMSIDYDPVANRGVCGGPSDQIAVFTYQRQTMELNRKPDIGIKNGGINCVRIRQDQKVFVSGGWDGRVRIFSWKSLRPLAVLTEHKNGGVMDIAFSTGKVLMWNANIMAAAGADAQVTLWDLYN